jgi:hypothetical protein
MTKRISSKRNLFPPMSQDQSDSKGPPAACPFLCMRADYTNLSISAVAPGTTAGAPPLAVTTTEQRDNGFRNQQHPTCSFPSLVRAR